MGREVEQGIRQVLLNGVKPPVVLSRRATSRFENLRDEIPASSEHLGVVRQASGLTRWWTFAGTVENRAFAKLLANHVLVKRTDALGLNLQSPPPDLNLPDLSTETVKLNDDDLAREAETMKFSETLPATLLQRVVLARGYGTSGGPNDGGQIEGTELR